MSKPRIFKTIGKYTQHTHIFAPVREIINGPRGPEFRNRDLENAVIRNTPTPVTDEQADLLRESKQYGVVFVEITGARETAKKVSAVRSQKEATDKSEANSDPDEADTHTSDDEASALGHEAGATIVAEEVTDLNEAYAFLVGSGVKKEDLVDKNGRVNYRRIMSAAEKMGVTFPNL